MKKLFLFFIPLMCLSAAFADCCNTCCEVPCCCDPCDTCCFSPCCCEPCDFVAPCPPEDCAYNAPYIIDVCSCFDVYVTGTFLWWKAYEENIELGATDSDTTLFGGLPISGNIVGMDFEYDPGFKVGLGFFFGCDNWDLNVEYTRFHTSINASATAPTGGSIWAYWGSTDVVAGNDGAVSVSASSTWKLEMDYVDFHLRREFWVGKEVTVKPFFGLRAAWVDQTYNATFVGYNQDADGLSNMKNKADFNGVGISAGIDTNWFFCGGFRMFGNILATSLYADYDLSTTQEVLNAGVVLPAEAVSLKYSPDYLRSSTEFSIGLGWGDYFCCNDWYFDLTIGYDFNAYWNYNTFIQFINGDNAALTKNSLGNLYVHGLNVTARLHF